MTGISWRDALIFCNTLSETLGLAPCYVVNGTSNKREWNPAFKKNDVTCNFSANGYRLPTSVEWEFAAQEGKSKAKWRFSGSDNIEDVAWYRSNSGDKVHNVATKKANALGLYDMSGNAAELCTTYWEDATTRFCYRGGSFWDFSSYCETSSMGYPEDQSSERIGFRIARSADEKTLAEFIKSSTEDVPDSSSEKKKKESEKDEEKSNIFTRAKDKAIEAKDKVKDGAQNMKDKMKKKKK